MHQLQVEFKAKNNKIGHEKYFLLVNFTICYDKLLRQNDVSTKYKILCKNIQEVF